MRATCGHTARADVAGLLQAILSPPPSVAAAIVPERIAYAERPRVTRLPGPPPGEPPESPSV